MEFKTNINLDVINIAIPFYMVQIVISSLVWKTLISSEPVLLTLNIFYKKNGDYLIFLVKLIFNYIKLIFTIVNKQITVYEYVYDLMGIVQ